MLSFSCLAVVHTVRSRLKPLLSATRKSILIDYQISTIHCRTLLYLRKKDRDFYIAHAMDPEAEAKLTPLRLSVKEQGDLLRKMKAEKAPTLEIERAVAELKIRKKTLTEEEAQFSNKEEFDRVRFEDLLKQRFFFDQSFSIYGGVQGFYDFGPMGCSIKANVLSLWRQHFILEEQMLEVDCAVLTPEHVLKASGHLDRFTDFMATDAKTGDCYRADHLIKAHLESLIANKKTEESVKETCRAKLVQLEGMNKDELQGIIKEFNMKATLTQNDLTDLREFNLMFATSIGPVGHMKGFLRPETAQGIFVNFKRLLDFNQGKLPFAAAQIGPAFRNEISPRSGLLRVREFTMAEIEHFVDPSDKRHPKFTSVCDYKMMLYSACDQMEGRSAKMVSVKEAVESGTIAHETLAYFMVRIAKFLLRVGINPGKLRFRQHMDNEMAHYACDCWDAELNTSYGWVECVGCADRSAYDLKAHSVTSGTRLCAERRLSTPIVEEVTEVLPNMKVLGKIFRGKSKDVGLLLQNIEDVESLETGLLANGVHSLTLPDGEVVEVTSAMVDVRRSTRTKHVEEFIPSVVEPSFGIGRILYAIFEHNYRVREGDEQRTYLALPAVIAPFKCSVLPLSQKPEFLPFIQQLTSALSAAELSYRVDDSSGSVGRRYARTDQIAIPYGITLDFDTINVLPRSATLRERDSMQQIRVPLEEIPPLVKKLSFAQLEWKQALELYPIFEQQETGK